MHKAVSGLFSFPYDCCLPSMIVLLLQGILRPECLKPFSRASSILWAMTQRMFLFYADTTMFLVDTLRHFSVP